MVKPGDSVSPVSTTADIRTAAENSPEIKNRDSQLLFGESFIVESLENDFVYGTSQIDGYQGFIQKSDVTAFENESTHIVDALHTDIYPEPNFKTRPILKLSFMSRVYVPDPKTENGFIYIPDQGWIFAGHITPLQNLKPSSDYADIALKFLGAPYLYGGRSALGLDCSALIQLTLLRAGGQSKRDSDQQAAMGQSLEKPENLQRNDIVFFEGHVGIMVDDTQILNATARTMDVRIETLSNLLDHYGQITALYRPIPLDKAE